MKSKQSKPLNLQDHAVPQGSILGGLIFIIFSNDFPACNQVEESVVYVDDDPVVVQDSDPELLRQKIKLEADLSADWLRDNRMCVAGEKSKLLIIGTKKLRDMKLSTPDDIMVDDKKKAERSTPTTALLRMTNALSVQQLVAYQTLVMVITTSKPAYTVPCYKEN